MYMGCDSTEQMGQNRVVMIDMCACYSIFIPAVGNSFYVSIILREF